MNLKSRIEEVLEHYDYCLVSVKGVTTDNKIVVNYPTTNAIIFRNLTISFGAERVSKFKGSVKVTS